MKARSQYLLKNTASLALGRLGTKLIAFLMVPLYTYALTAEEYGTVDLLVTLSTILMPLLILNVHEAVVRFGLDQGADPRQILSTGLLLLAGGAFLGLLLIPLSEQGGWLYAYVLSMACCQLFLCFLRGQEKLAAYSLGNLLYAAAQALLNVLFLLVMDWGVEGCLLAGILANLLCALYAGVVGKAVGEFSLDPALSRRMIAYSVILIPNTLLWWIINASGRILLSAMVGAAANGIFALAAKIPQLLMLPAEIFNQAWLHSAVREDGSGEGRVYQEQIFRRMVQCLTVVTAGIFLIIKPFLQVYAAPEYHDAWKYTPCLLLGFLFLSLAGFLATAYTVHKDSVGFLLSAALGAAVNLLLNLLLIPSLGVGGAAMATGLSYFAVFLFRAIHTRRYIRVRVFRREHWLGYGLLMLLGAALYVEGLVGHGLRLLLFAAVLWLCRDFWLGILRFCSK